MTRPPGSTGFAAHAAARHCVGRTSLMISRLGRLLAETGTATPQAILEQATRPGRSAGNPRPGPGGLLHRCRARVPRRPCRPPRGRTPPAPHRGDPRTAAASRGPLRRRPDHRPAAGPASRHPPARRSHPRRRPGRPPRPSPVPRRRAGQDRLGHRPGCRPGGIPRRAPGKPGPAADHHQVVLPLGPGQPPCPRQSRGRDPRWPASRLPSPHPRRHRAAAPVPPLDHRPGRPPARGADRPARAPARRAVPGSA